VTWNPFRIVRSDLGFEARQRAAQQLKDAYYEGVTDPKVPEFVLEQVKAVVDMKTNSLRAMEGKAAQLIGFSGTVVAVVGLFGRSLPTGILGAIVLSLLLAIGCSIVSMWVREDDLPSPSLYNLNTLPSDDPTRARIAMALAEAYTGYSLDLQHMAAIKGRWLRTGLVVFGLGVVGLAFVAFTPTNPPAATLNVKCYTSCERNKQHGRP